MQHEITAITVYTCDVLRQTGILYLCICTQTGIFKSTSRS